jgi:Uma2 family endonuclease
MRNVKESERTIEDLMALPEDKKAELINGVIYMMAPASLEHSRTSGALTTRLTDFVEQRQKGPNDPDSWVIVPEAWTYYDKHNSFVHNLAAFLLKDLSQTTDREAIKACPLWVCEILSPSNWINDTQHKRVVLEKYRIPFYWLVDPIRKAIQVFELKDNNEHYQILQVVQLDDGVVKLPPFNDLELDLSKVFKF